MLPEDKEGNDAADGLAVAGAHAHGQRDAGERLKAQTEREAQIKADAVIEDRAKRMSDLPVTPLAALDQD